MLWKDDSFILDSDFDSGDYDDDEEVLLEFQCARAYNVVFFLRNWNCLFCRMK